MNIDILLEIQYSEYDVSDHVYDFRITIIYV